MAGYTQFTRAQFEDVLPRNEATHIPQWRGVGLQKGQYCYRVEIMENRSCIFICSSIQADGLAAPESADSIRLWLGDIKTMAPLAPKVSTHIKRTEGWDQRLIQQIKKYREIAKQLSTCKCGQSRRLFQVKKEGPTKGRWFANCPVNCPESFQWLEL